MSVASHAGAVVRQGHLRKLKTMKKKFFVLRAETPESSARLEYYESEKKFRSGAAPRRTLPLKSCYNITRRLDLKQKHVIALFTREEQFCIVAENEQDLHGWLTAILKHHRNEDGSEELLYPIQHVWQVNVQKKGLGATRNIQGLYNLCLTDKTLTLVKIKTQNNTISDLSIPERVEYSLKNIRTCGDSECFFYMEVGRQTTTGSGELWMLSDDSNIAQSMHSTVLHAMKNCSKRSENERDHVIQKSYDVGSNPLPARRQTLPDSRGRSSLSNDNKGLCVGSCIRHCVCSATRSVDESAAGVAPLAPLAPLAHNNAENQPPNNSLTDKEPPPRIIKHHRTVSLPTGCPLFQEPLKIVHERTRSAPLTGDEVDRAVLEKIVSHSSCKAVNGTDFAKKAQWSRRASTGARLSKLSPAHSKNAGPLRNRCDSMPSRATASFEAERPPPRLNDHSDGVEPSRDEPDSVEWHRTPRIPEEPDFCDPAGPAAARDLMSTSLRGSSVHHSRTSSLGADDALLEPAAVPDGYLPMAPAHDHLGGLVSASSGSVCSGTPSTDPRFSEYQLEPATSHIVDSERPPRAYSVGSRPPPRADPPRHRAYSVGARNRPPPPQRHQHTVCSAPLLPRASAEDLMELDFSNNSPTTKVVVARTPPATASGFATPAMVSRPRAVDEYVDMSPRNAGYVEMRPGDVMSRSPPAVAAVPATVAPQPVTPDGYVEMIYGRAPTRPIAITNVRPAPVVASSPDDRRRSRNGKENRTPIGKENRTPLAKENHTPLGSQTLFPLSLDSPASPPELDSSDVFDDDPPHHPLTTVKEISEECGRRSPEISSSPSYVKLALPGSKPIAAPTKSPEMESVELSCNPLAMKTIARGDCDNRAEPSTATLVLAGGGAPTRFSVSDDKVSPPPASPLTPAPPLNYAALDLEPKKASAAPAPRTYTQIDFVRSEKLHAADGN